MIPDFEIIQPMKLQVYRRWKRRMLKCVECKYSQKLYDVVTCGKPIVGEVITHEGKEVELCGCLMNIKTKLPDAKCPINKWQNDTIKTERIHVHDSHRMEGGDTETIY
jgi:hypothetical protein